VLRGQTNRHTRGHTDKRAIIDQGVYNRSTIQCAPRHAHTHTHTHTHTACSFDGITVVKPQLVYKER